MNWTLITGNVQPLKCFNRAGGCNRSHSPWVSLVTVLRVDLVHMDRNVIALRLLLSRNSINLLTNNTGPEVLFQRAKK